MTSLDLREAVIRSLERNAKPGEHARDSFAIAQEIAKIRDKAPEVIQEMVRQEAEKLGIRVVG